MTTFEPRSDSIQHDDRNTASLPSDSPAWHAIQPASLEEAAKIFVRHPAELTRLIDAGYLHADASGTSQVLDINELQALFKGRPVERGSASRGFVSSYAGHEILTEREAALHLGLSLGCLGKISGSLIQFEGPRRSRRYKLVDLDAYLGGPDLNDVVPTAKRVSFTDPPEWVIVARQVDDDDEASVIDDEDYFRSMTTTTSRS